jgi:hypothetical protein
MTVGEVLRVFEKLEMEIREGRDTLAFFRWEGRTILWTKVPHKRDELPGRLPHLIRQQLKLNEEQLREVQDCRIWRKEYIEILKAKVVLP